MEKMNKFGGVDNLVQRGRRSKLWKITHFQRGKAHRGRLKEWPKNTQKFNKSTSFDSYYGCSWTLSLSSIHKKSFLR